jgi:hypothetical protein
MMNIYQSLKILITLLICLTSLFLTQTAKSNTTITTTHNDNTSTIVTIPEVGPDVITTVITPSVLSSSTLTTRSEDGRIFSTTVTAPVTPGLDTPSTTTVINQDE